MSEQESVSASPAPTQPEPITYRHVSKALQFITDRSKPVLVPLLCKLWDKTQPDTVSELADAIKAGEDVKSNPKFAALDGDVLDLLIYLVGASHTI